MKIPLPPSRRDVTGTILAGIGLGALYWLIQSSTDAFLFHKGEFFQQFLHPDRYQLFMRLQAVFSKNGEIERPDQIGDFIRLVLTDAKEDFLQDNQEAVDALDKAKQKRVYNVGSMIAFLLKEYL